MSHNNFYFENSRWLAITTLLYFSSSFGQTFFIAIFAGAIREEFGISHTIWGTIYAVGTLSSAVLMFKFGGFADKREPRRLGSIIIISLALSCFGMMLVQHAWALPILIFGLRFFGQGFASHLSMVLCGRWFHKNRGRTVAVTSLGFAFGEALLPLIFVSIMGWIGWRFSWGIATLLLLLVAIFYNILLNNERTPKSVLNNVSSNNISGLYGKHWTKGEVLKSWVSWPMLIAIMAQSMFGTIFFFQQVTLGIEKGWEINQFAMLVPVYTVVSIISTFIAGSLIDKFGVRRLVPFYLIPGMLGFLIGSFLKDPIASSLTFALLGMTTGLSNSFSGTFWPEFFGTKHLGDVRAIATSSMVIASALGPLFSGFFLDLNISLSVQFQLMASIMIICTIGLGIISLKTKSDMR